jgi:RimJ/RimL family protein N-acetyltransferase
MRRRVEQHQTITDQSGQLAITDDDGRFLGEVTWFARHWGPAPESTCWQLGILVLPEHRGRGHGSAAQALVTDYLFAHTRAGRIEAATDVANLAERRALLKAGFIEEGILRRANWRDRAWRDRALHSRLRDG